MRKLFTIIAISFILFGFSSKAPDNGGTPLYATMLGVNEAPVPGDPDGEGWAEFRLNQGQGTISYEIHVEDIQAPRAAHIHVGRPGAPGPIVVHLMAPVNGMSMGVADVDPELIKMIRKNPGDYYVNVHNATYPGGALRGQLMK